VSDFNMIEASLHQGIDDLKQQVIDADYKINIYEKALNAIGFGPEIHPYYVAKIARKALEEANEE